jgi:hypothetical protein
MRSRRWSRPTYGLRKLAGTHRTKNGSVGRARFGGNVDDSPEACLYHWSPSAWPAWLADSRSGGIKRNTRWGLARPGALYLMSRARGVSR